jgi:hypothetical protein
MRAVTGLARSILGMFAALGLATGCVSLGTARATASTGGGMTGACNPYVDGTLIPVPCAALTSSSGYGASSSDVGGAGSKGTIVSNSCPATVLDMTQAQSLGLSWPPPIGHSWALLLCFAGVLGAGPQAVLVNSRSDVPAVTPQQLLVTALGELHIPYPSPATAPPRGHGLVGLPEWFWAAAGTWHTRRVRVTAGPVWAVVTAVPTGLTFGPGPGLIPVTCAGPGAAYNPQEPSTEQHTDCSYTYLRPSTGQPGNAYPASVTATWRVTWTGSGDTGGILDAALAVSAHFTVAVAQAEALVASP